MVLKGEQKIVDFAQLSLITSLMDGSVWAPGRVESLYSKALLCALARFYLFKFVY